MENITFACVKMQLSHPSLGTGVSKGNGVEGSQFFFVFDGSQTKVFRLLFSCFFLNICGVQIFSQIQFLLVFETSSITKFRLQMLTGFFFSPPPFFPLKSLSTGGFRVWNASPLGAQKSGTFNSRLVLI